MANNLPLFPLLPQTPSGPLARAAQQAPLHSTGCLTEYRPLKSRSILSKTQSRRGFPFTHAINPYRGCEFACRYCYARYTHEFLEQTPEEFEQKIYFKEHAAWLLRQELSRLKQGTQIALGTATDPYQPLERRERITRSILEVFASTSGFKLGIVSKSPLILRDLELLQKIRERHELSISLTVTTVNTRLARILEPRAPRPDLRIDALSRLRKAGLRTGVLCSPLMPGITDSRSSIAAVAKAAASAGASFFAAGALFLKPCSLPTFLGFVQEHFPDQLSAYQRRYGQSAFVSSEYRTRLAEVVGSVCREHKLGRRFREDARNQDDNASAAVAIQPWLPFS